MSLALSTAQITTQTLRIMKNKLPLELILKVLQYVEFQIVLPSIAMYSAGAHSHYQGLYSLRLGINCWEDITVGMKWSMPCLTHDDIIILQTYEIESVAKKSIKVKETQLAICSAESYMWNNPYHTALDYTPTPKISYKTIKYAKEGARNDWTGLGTSRTSKTDGDIAFGGYKHPKHSFADLFYNEDNRPHNHHYIATDFDPNFNSKLTLDEKWNGTRRFPPRLPTKTITLKNVF